MEIRVLPPGETLAHAAAAVIAADAWRARDERRPFLLAVSGGQTPGLMLQALVEQDVPWGAMHVVQVDERVAPRGHADRNLTQLQAALLAPDRLPPDNLHAMPVEASDLRAGAAQYARTLEDLAGTPPVLDLVHLGLGVDGHTASLLPDDPVLDVVDATVAVTAEYRGWRRMTLTLPVLNRARRVLWLVSGTEKATMLSRLCRGDASIPAGRVHRDRACVLADLAAAQELPGDR
ncbi:MAG: 6-phosphogluconolactonase [Pirellulaceae bacterium]